MVPFYLKSHVCPEPAFRYMMVLVVAFFIRGNCVSIKLEKGQGRIIDDLDLLFFMHQLEAMNI